MSINDFINSLSNLGLFPKVQINPNSFSFRYENGKHAAVIIYPPMSGNPILTEYFELDKPSVTPYRPTLAELHEILKLWV